LRRYNDKGFNKGLSKVNIKRDGFLKLLEKDFQGNCAKCARALNVNTSTVCRVINGNSKGGIKLLTKLMQYCKSNDISYEDIIFIE